MYTDRKIALVRLGNEALAESRKQQQQGGDGDTKTAAAQQQLYTYISSGINTNDDNNTNDNDEDGTVLFFGVDQMRSLPSALDRALKFYELAGQRGSAEGWYNRGHLRCRIAHSKEEGDGDDDGSSSNKSSLQDKREDGIGDGNSNVSSSWPGTAIVPPEFVKALQAFRNAM